jgi:EAL domain-containing protein (putative c-di-GMP-specific phosphodiesterase class I)/GGDEF domain-containing protein
MTLYRQLLVWVLLIFGLMLTVVYSIEFQSTRDYLSSQQESEVINTSTSLGLALTPYLESGDRVGAESVINAIFDGGFYRKIELKMYTDGSMIERSNAVRVSQIPQWFTDMELFAPVSHEQVLTSGWLQLGDLTLTGHPGFAYQQLWSSMTDLLSWFVIGFLVTVIALIRSLKFLLYPLEQIRHQAEEIQQHHFGKPIRLPKTQELKEVVSAINLMSAKLAQQYKEQVAEAESLRRSAFQDSVSGLGNRSYFMGQSQSWLAESGVGGILMIGVPRLETLYRDEGYHSRDQMVRSIADCLVHKLEFNNQISVARMTATDFAVLVPGFDAEQLKKLGEKLQVAIGDLFLDQRSDAPPFGAIGVVEREDDDDISSLLAKADEAMLQGLKLPLAPVVLSERKAAGIGRAEWKRFVLDAIAARAVHFRVQPATYFESREEYHGELFTTIEVQGKHYGPGQFMAAVEQFQLGGRFDQMVLESVAEYLKRERSRSLAINLTLSALLDNHFRIWLVEFIAAHKGVVKQLSLEIPETAFVYHFGELSALFDMLKHLGVTLGVDQYGRHLQSLGYLEKVKPSYVKVDYGYTVQALGEGGDPHLLKAITRAASNLSVVTIVQRVEDEAQVERLAALGIDAYQGFVAPPASLAIKE